MKLHNPLENVLSLEDKMNVYDCGMLIFNEPIRTNFANTKGYSWSSTSFSHWIPLCETIYTSIAWLPKEEHHA